VNKVIRVHRDRSDGDKILKLACDELNCDFIGEIPIKIQELKEKGRLSQYRVTDFLFGISRFRGATDSRISLTLFETFLTICLHAGESVRELAGRLMKDPVGVYNEIKRLEGYGLIDLRQKDGKVTRRGKRPKAVFLSSKGNQLLEEMLA
jgi:DNA-binding MarR family transcriptional regulator